MDNNLYTDIGYAVVCCVKYIFIPIGVSVSARIITDKLLKPQPEKQRTKRFNKNRL
jgi:hypothetical protein